MKFMYSRNLTPFNEDIFNRLLFIYYRIFPGGEGGYLLRKFIYYNNLSIEIFVYYNKIKNTPYNGYISLFKNGTGDIKI